LYPDGAGELILGGATASDGIVGCSAVASTKTRKSQLGREKRDWKRKKELRELIGINGNKPQEWAFPKFLGGVVFLTQRLHMSRNHKKKGRVDFEW
jgi:hypothetical protein